MLIIGKIRFYFTFTCCMHVSGIIKTITLRGSLLLSGGVLLAWNATQTQVNFKIAAAFTGSFSLNSGQGTQIENIFYTKNNPIDLNLSCDIGNILYHIKGDTPAEITGFETSPYSITKILPLTPAEGQKTIQIYLDHGLDAFVYDPIKIILDTTPPTQATQARIQADSNVYLFSWTASQDTSNAPIQYTVQISTDTTFSTILTQPTGRTSSALIAKSSLTQSEIFWRIISKDAAGNTTLSSPVKTQLKQTTPNNGAWGGGWGGSVISQTKPQENTQTGNNIATDDQHAAALQPAPKEPEISMLAKVRYGEELLQGYTYAYEKGITTVGNAFQAKLKEPLLRKHMAKMISIYAQSILKKIPNNSKLCSFSDTNNLDLEMKYYTQLACKLGLMGYESDGIQVAKQFNPEKEVSRAEFGTIFSRVLFGLKNNVPTNQTDVPRYRRHLNALKNNSIMNNITPTLIELRGYVMIMMMRSDFTYKAK